MSNTWLSNDDRIDLPALFKFMGYELVRQTESFQLYREGKRYYVVLFAEEGYQYYYVGRPQRKLRASDLVRAYVARMEGINNDSVWDKMDAYYQEVMGNTELLIKTKGHSVLKQVPNDFNHFETYRSSTAQIDSDFYQGLLLSNKFKESINCSETGHILFPLRNLQNELCGYFEDNQGVRPLGESAIGNALWYSDIPKTIDWLIIFKDPLEALAFDKKFQLENVVYLALGEINYQTTKILSELQRLTKVKKMVMSFTGTKKIEGYLRDLHFMSFINDSNIQLSIGEKDLSVRFKMQDEKSFLRLFNYIKKFNQGLSKSYLKYNTVLDQNLMNQYSILPSKDQGGIKVRIPLEVNAIKYFVWCYFKIYLSKSMDILKPKYPSWYMEWEATQSIQISGKEGAMEEYRIAL